MFLLFSVIKKESKNQKKLQEPSLALLNKFVFYFFLIISFLTYTDCKNQLMLYVDSWVNTKMNFYLFIRVIPYTDVWKTLGQ